MLTIWKFDLQPAVFTLQTVHMPQGAIVRSAGTADGDRPCIWAEVFTDRPVEARRFSVCWTGQSLPAGERASFIGTVVLNTGIVCHVYERP